MLSDIATWVESHPVTVGLLQATALVFIAWVSGLFAYFGRFKARPYLRIANTASFVFIERLPPTADHPTTMRASFVINASLINASNERVVLDQFELSYQAHSFWRSHRQRLLRLAFPARPRKRVGSGLKYMGVWFTEYPLDEVNLEVISGALDPKDHCGGYLLFTSFTYGSWNPRIRDGRVRVRLKAALTSHKRLSVSAKLRVTEDASFIEEFSPGLNAHVAHESTWNHDLSVLSR